MVLQKIRPIAAGLVFLFLAVFFTGTSLLAYRNGPVYMAALFFAALLVAWVVLLPEKRPSQQTNLLKNVWPYVLLSLATLIPRLLWLLSVNTSPTSDFKFYQRVAEQLSQGTLGESTYIALYPHVVGYPFILSLIYRVFGNDILFAQILNLAAALGIVLGIYWLSAQIMHQRFALLAGLLVALWPSMIFFTPIVSTEGIFTLLIVGCSVLLFLIKDIQKIPLGIGLFGLLGMAVGVVNAVRPFGLLFMAAASLYYLLFVKPAGSGLRPWLVKLVFFASLILGYLLMTNLAHWKLEQTLHTDVGKSFLGYSLLVGANYESSGMWNQADADTQLEIYQVGKTPPDEVNRVLLGRAVQRIRSNPLQFLYLQFRKNKILWQDDTFGIYWNRWFQDEKAPGVLDSAIFNALEPVSNYYYFVLLALGLLGSLAGLIHREQSYLLFVALLMSGTIGIFIFTEVQPRYHYNALPLIAIIASYGLDHLNHRSRLLFRATTRDQANFQTTPSGNQGE